MGGAEIYEQTEVTAAMTSAVCAALLCLATAVSAQVALPRAQENFGYSYQVVTTPPSASCCRARMPGPGWSRWTGERASPGCRRGP